MVATVKPREESLTEINRLVRDIYSLDGRKPDEQNVNTVMDILGLGYEEPYAVILYRGTRVVNYLLSNRQATSTELLELTKIPGEHPIHKIRYLGSLGPILRGVIVPVGDRNHDPQQCLYGLASRELGERYVELATTLKKELESLPYSR